VARGPGSSFCSLVPIRGWRTAVGVDAVSHAKVLPHEGGERLPSGRRRVDHAILLQLERRHRALHVRLQVCRPVLSRVRGGRVPHGRPPQSRAHGGARVKRSHWTMDARRAHDASSRTQAEHRRAAHRAGLGRGGSRGANDRGGSPGATGWRLAYARMRNVTLRVPHRGRAGRCGRAGRRTSVGRALVRFHSVADVEQVLEGLVVRALAVLALRRPVHHAAWRRGPPPRGGWAAMLVGSVRRLLLHTMRRASRRARLAVGGRFGLEAKGVEARGRVAARGRDDRRGRR